MIKDTLRQIKQVETEISIQRMKLGRPFGEMYKFSVRSNISKLEKELSALSSMLTELCSQHNF